MLNWMVLISLTLSVAKANPVHLICLAIIGSDAATVFHSQVLRILFIQRANWHTCLLISAPVWSSHNKHSGWPPNAAMWVGVCANLEVTEFTPQPTWTRRMTHSSCGRYKQGTGTQTGSDFIHQMLNATSQEGMDTCESIHRFSQHTLSKHVISLQTVGVTSAAVV